MCWSRTQMHSAAITALNWSLHHENNTTQSVIAILLIFQSYETKAEKFVKIPEITKEKRLPTKTFIGINPSENPDSLLDILITADSAGCILVWAKGRYPVCKLQVNGYVDSVHITRDFKTISACYLDQESKLIKLQNWNCSILAEKSQDIHALSKEFIFVRNFILCVEDLVETASSTWHEKIKNFREKIQEFSELAESMRPN